MKKAILLSFSLLIAIICLTSCMTAYDHGTDENLSYEDNLVKMSVAYSVGDNVCQVDFVNKSDEGIVFITDYASCNNSKLVFGDSRIIDSYRSQPVVPVGPKSIIAQKMYLADDGIIFSMSSFTFGYKDMNGKETFISLSEQNNSASRFSETLGEISVDKTNWIFLFLRSPESRQKELKELLLEKAKSTYGQDVEIGNVRYEGKWSPASLLFYFSMLGWVENASATATVYRP